MVSAVSIVAAVALLAGSVGYVTFPLGLSAGIRSAINLAENGMVYPLYMKPPFATKSAFHLFAVRNPSQVLAGAKMSFELKGPYEFDTWLVRDKITFSKQGDRVRFESGRRLVPVARWGRDERSANGSSGLDEPMWLVNPILPSTVRTVRSMLVDRVPFGRLASPVVFRAVNLLLDNYNERLLMRMTPRQILMGRKVRLMEALSSLAGRFGLVALLPPGPPQNTFGLAFVQNHTVDRQELYTGTGSSAERFAEVVKWKDKPTLDMWPGACSSISGTNGELFKPLLAEGEPLQVFLGPLCRSFELEPVMAAPTSSSGASRLTQPITSTAYSANSSAKRAADEALAETAEAEAAELADTGAKPVQVLTPSGVRGYEYELGSRLYLGTRNYPANGCFCESARSLDCQYDGLIAMGPCFFDAPLFFARANFRQVDERIRRTIDYKSLLATSRLPDKQSFTLEPITGTVLQVNLTLMALFKVKRQAYMRDLAQVRNLTYAPLFATTESVALPFNLVWQLYLLQLFNDYHRPVMAASALGGAAVLVAKFLFGV